VLHDVTVLQHDPVHWRESISRTKQIRDASGAENREALW
jgi:hypothetical protein